MDSDDNGIDDDFPEINGIFSGVVVLTRVQSPEPTGETYLSGEADPGSPANQGYSPTGWDGPLSRGRFGEADNTSNLTIDFGFIPPMSLGNRVWIDEGAGTTPFRNGYNNGVQDGTEVGVSGVTVQLWRDISGTPTLMDTVTTDATGYYLFERLQPASDYYVHIPAANFAEPDNHCGISPAALTRLLLRMMRLIRMTMALTMPRQPQTGLPARKLRWHTLLSLLTTRGTETDINTSGTYGPNNVGNYGQE